MRALRVAALAVSCALIVAGCGTNDRDQVRAKVEQFVHAISVHDYRTLCTQVLGARLLQRLAAGGIGCEQAMGISLGRVHAPILSIGRITVSGSTAQAITLSGAAGEGGAFETIGLVKTGQGWRVTSLATPAVGPTGR
jgi:hypothetical protein